MQILEIESNNSWEEVVKYYYTSKNISIDLFIEDVNKEITLELNDLKEVNTNETSTWEDFELFQNKTGIAFKNFKLYCLLNEWDCKVHVIQGQDTIVARLWLTTA